jgi:excinuclease ABC subunit C
MEEVVYRRYRRLLEEDEPLPQLVIVDGGKGQLSSGVTALERLGLRGKIPIIGIAKRLEELFYPNDPVPLYLDKRSESLKVIQQMRNEAHRFGISHHRNKRSKQAIETELDEIPGIGEKTTVDLLRHFRSVKRVKEATKQELTAIVGNSKAQKIVDFYKEHSE